MKIWDSVYIYIAVCQANHLSYNPSQNTLLATRLLDCYHLTELKLKTFFFFLGPLLLIQFPELFVTLFLYQPNNFITSKHIFKYSISFCAPTDYQFHAF